MTERFGYRFTKQFGTTPCGSWARDLADLSPREIRRGLKIIGESGAEWPPSGPEFFRMCRPSDPVLVAAYMPPQRQLPKEIKTPEEHYRDYRYWRDQSRKALGRAPVYEDENGHDWNDSTACIRCGVDHRSAKAGEPCAYQPHTRK